MYTHLFYITGLILFHSSIAFTVFSILVSMRDVFQKHFKSYRSQTFELYQVCYTSSDRFLKVPHEDQLCDNWKLGTKTFVCNE